MGLVFHSWSEFSLFPFFFATKIKRLAPQLPPNFFSYVHMYMIHNKYHPKMHTALRRRMSSVRSVVPPEVPVAAVISAIEVTTTSPVTIEAPSHVVSGREIVTGAPMSRTNVASTVVRREVVIVEVVEVAPTWSVWSGESAERGHGSIAKQTSVSRIKIHWEVWREIWNSWGCSWKKKFMKLWSYFKVIPRSELFSHIKRTIF